MTSRTIRNCLALAETLTGSVEEARVDVEVLLAHALGKDKAYLYTWPNQTVAEPQLRLFLDGVERRRDGEPIAYIIGEKAFWSLDLEVNSSVLIPRPETELLVELAIDKCFAEAQVLDLGTGSGAVALAIAGDMPSTKIVAVDSQPEALCVAKSNAQRNKIDNVEFLTSDWFDGVIGCFDLIVGNPPYIREQDQHLAQGGLCFEPESALVSGEDGLKDIRQICKDAARYMYEGAWLMLEHGWDQGEDVRALFAARGYESIETIRDYGGKERVTMARGALE